MSAAGPRVDARHTARNERARRFHATPATRRMAGMNEAKPTSTNLRAMLLGAAAAAMIAACESAPEKDAWEKAADKTKEAAEAMHEAASESADDAWKATREGAGKALDKTGDALDEAKKATERLKEKVEED